LLRRITTGGALLLPTEFIRDKQQAAFTGQTFDLQEAASTRGFITECFRRSEGVTRSTNPIYNVSVLGEGYDKALVDHWELPYTMDVGSPWHQFMEAGGKIVFLGVSLATNSMIHMPEYLLKDAYPRPVFYNQPHAFQLVGPSGEHREVLAYMHAIQWPVSTGPKFCNYLNEKRSIYHKAVVGRAEITVVGAKEQYEALLAELEQGVCWYDAMYWP
jgi:aminoglycoside N3'-acetyltransferase